MAERPSNLYGYVWRTPDTGSHRFSTLGRVSIPVSLSTRCRTIGGTCRSPDYSNKMTETDVEAADGSVSLICVLWDDWHVIVWHGPARIRRAPRRTTAGSWRARRARAPATPATRCPCATHDRYSPPPSSARPWRRRHNLHLIYFDFPHFSITLLHDLWFAHDQLVMVFCWWIALLSHLCCCDFNKTIRFATWRGCDKNPIQSVDVV